MIKMLLIPSTFTGEMKDRKMRIYKIAMVARAAATFGITDIGVYYEKDPKFDSHGLGRYIVKVLKYINCPPYLRKIAFPLEKDLEEVGVAVPLKAPHHLKKGVYRYAYVVEKKRDILLVDDGEDQYEVKIGEGYREGENIVVVNYKKKITVDKRKLPMYFGFDPFYYNKPLRNLIFDLKKRGFYVIGTSRYGDDVRRVEIPRRRRIAIAFGSFARGLREIVGKDWKDVFDVVINTVPDQFVETIRTEEAILYTLAVLRYVSVI